MGQDIAEAVKSGSLIIAHRGARSLAPENTIASARAALGAGAHMWEIDVRLSRDGHLVVVHDETLDRTSNARALFPERKPWHVHDFTLRELKSLDFGSWFNAADPFKQISAGVVGEAELKSYRGERIPTIEEALLFTVGRDWLVNVEIKDLCGLPGDETIAEKVADVVVSLNVYDRVIVSSFNHHYLGRVKKAAPGALTAPLVKSPPSDPEALMSELGAFTYHPAMRALRPSHLQRLTSRGFGVLVWVVNNARTARFLFRHGVSGVFSDFPQKLRETA